MTRHFQGLTDPGLVRAVNQDHFYVDEPEGRFFIVADGMGGHAGGQEASQIATKQIQTHLHDFWDTEVASDDLLKEALHRANQAILEDQIDNPERGDMGTTVVVLMFRNGQPWCAHIGDSRLYLLRKSNLQQVTADHTWVGMALQAGEISLDEAKTHPWRHVLSQCLGRKDIYQMDIQALEILAGDRLLLCSDGLTEEVGDDTIGSFLFSSLSCEDIATELIEEAKRGGGSDNITVVVINEE
jgi:PPM family protein phosphatase